MHIWVHKIRDEQCDLKWTAGVKFGQTVVLELKNTLTEPYCILKGFSYGYDMVTAVEANFIYKKKKNTQLQMWWKNPDGSVITTV